MIHPEMAFEYSKIRQEELIRQAKQHRLVIQARKARRANQPSMMDRVAWVVGNQLVKADERLTSRQITPDGKAI